MKTVSWNVRGLGVVGKKASVKVIANLLPEILFIQESKIQEVEEIHVKAVWSGGNVGWIAKDS